MYKLFLQTLLALAVALTPIAHAQSSMDSNPANCNELTDPDIKYQMDLCSAHLGCRLVMGIQNVCTKTKKFLNNLKEAMTRDEGYPESVTS